MQQRERSGLTWRRRAWGVFSTLLPLVLVVLAGLLRPCPTSAQRQSGATGAGFQVGRPGGLAFKLYRADMIAYDGVISSDGDDYIVGHYHRLWERPLPNSPLHLYLGPGLLVGPEDLGSSPELRLGLSAEAGLNFYAERFEVFLHVTPTLRFLPNTDVALDGNVGLRYYFRFP
jgi:hypothetical protein